MEIPSGAFGDRFGRRTTFITGLGLEATGTLVFAFAGDFNLLVVSYVIWSAGLAFRSGNDQAFLFETLKAGEREAEFSDRFGRYWALSTVSILAGGLLGGVLAQVTTLQVAIVASVVPFGLALPVVLAMQEPPWRQTHEATLSLRETLTTGVRDAWRKAPIRNLVLLEVALSGAFPAFFLLSQPFLARHDVPLAMFGLLAIPIHLTRAGAGMFSGAAVRRFGIGSTLVLSMAGVVTGLALIAAIDHVAAFAALALAMGSAMLAMPAIGAYINERTESHVRATVLSVAPMGTSLMLGAMSALAGTIADESIRVAFGVMALIIAVGGGLALMVFLASHEEAERATVGSAVEV
jgi:MFS family permease